MDIEGSVVIAEASPWAPNIETQAMEALARQVMAGTDKLIEAAITKQIGPGWAIEDLKGRLAWKTYRLNSPACAAFRAGPVE